MSCAKVISFRAPPDRYGERIHRGLPPRTPDVWGLRTSFSASMQQIPPTGTHARAHPAARCSHRAGSLQQQVGLFLFLLLLCQMLGVAQFRDYVNVEGQIVPDASCIILDSGGEVRVCRLARYKQVDFHIVLLFFLVQDDQCADDAGNPAAHGEDEHDE